ncbi:MAG: zinc ABC transporter substrate-binding protein [Nanoarchaeota archaeon]|nr:zinc ABC transporter substrate-binding protein [Nanoarchaeota archaeon]MBU4300635.1 zinc ABC transporter substrate-binding protein [Nanoarchaeota archaeon]MBU4452008.1 zinc ABC transporter substrate-binding protein [Nanoarchaeota archaeon]MCG2724228.1 zinc ABC transporter substrate-binding protein [archaeon]
MKTKVIIVSVLIVAVVLVAGCIDNTPKATNEKIKVVTTLFPLYEFAKEVGGYNVEVTLLLPPGAEAHTFEPKPSDIKKINDADVFLYIGAGMEPWAHDIVEGSNNKELLLIDASSKVTLIKSGEHEEHEHEAEEEHDHESEEHEEEHQHGEYDPHIWLDFDNDKKIIDAISQILAQKDQKNAEFYMKNAQQYNAKLSSLNQKYSDGLSNCKQKEFISGGHNAFAYLAHKYHLESISAFGVSPDSEPTPQKIKQIVDLTKEHNIKYIYFEKLVNPKMAETIAKEANAKTLVLNPAHNLLKEQFQQGVTFIYLMEENLQNLKIGLECE